ncbi:hypothetical protein Tco_0918525 [Tanacetum coccineum]
MPARTSTRGVEGETSNFSHESIKHCRGKESAYKSLPRVFPSSNKIRTQFVAPNFCISGKRRWEKFEFNGVYVGGAISEHSANFDKFDDVLMRIGSYEQYKSIGAEVEHPEPGFELQGAKMANEVLVTNGALQSEVGYLYMLDHEVGRLCDEYAWWKLTRRCWNTHVLSVAAIGTKWYKELSKLLKGVEVLVIE